MITMLRCTMLSLVPVGGAVFEWVGFLALMRLKAANCWVSGTENRYKLRPRFE